MQPVIGAAPPLAFAAMVRSRSPLSVALASVPLRPTAVPLPGSVETGPVESFLQLATAAMMAIAAMARSPLFLLIDVPPRNGCECATRSPRAHRRHVRQVESAEVSPLAGDGIHGETHREGRTEKKVHPYPLWLEAGVDRHHALMPALDDAQRVGHAGIELHRRNDERQ